MTATPSKTDKSAPRRAPRAGSISPLPRDDFDRNAWCVLGLPIDMLNVEEAASAVEAAVRDRRRLSIVTPNVNWLVRALTDPLARREILNADLSLADGAPIAAMAGLLGAPMSARAAGADLFEALRRRRPQISQAAGRRLRVFFFGGRDGAAEAAAAALAADQSGLEAAGALNPGHGDIDSMSGVGVIDAINAAAPDFVVVALGAAKGQAWIERNQAKLSAPIIAHLGAVVDFVAGAKARAPRWLRRVGLEWLWRIREEPSLLRRYWKDGIALGGLTVTRFFPQLFVGRHVDRGAAGAFIERAGAKLTIRLSGDLGFQGLSPIRAAFREAASADRDITLDFSSVGRVDRAFLGLLLMLEKHVRARQRDIAVKGLSRSLRALFKANAMNYPAADMTVEAADSASASAAAGGR